MVSLDLYLSFLLLLSFSYVFASHVFIHFSHPLCTDIFDSLPLPYLLLFSRRVCGKQVLHLVLLTRPLLSTSVSLARSPAGLHVQVTHLVCFIPL